MTGVQTCALPIYREHLQLIRIIVVEFACVPAKTHRFFVPFLECPLTTSLQEWQDLKRTKSGQTSENARKTMIGRATCRESVQISAVAVSSTRIAVSPGRAANTMPL